MRGSRSASRRPGHLLSPNELVVPEVGRLAPSAHCITKLRLRARVYEGALVSRVDRLRLTHQDDRLRWGNEELLLGRYTDDLPALRTQLVQLLLDVLAGIDDLVLVALH